MIQPGLTSVTFRSKTPEEVVNLALKAGLKGIEWGGDLHVPIGDDDLASEVFQLTRDAGLMVSAYGSYYTAGKSSDQGMRFSDILHTAEILHAPIIRIWAGEMGSKESTPDYRKKVLLETMKIADEAGKMGIRLAFEFHEDTLNDTYEACCNMLTELAHPYVYTLWQPIHGAGPDINGAGIEMILPWIAGIHVFHWWPDAELRLPLSAGITHWENYISRLSGIPGTIFGNLEFVKDDSSEQFLRDAEILLKITEG